MTKARKYSSDLVFCSPELLPVFALVAANRDEKMEAVDAAEIADGLFTAFNMLVVSAAASNASSGSLWYR